MKLKYVDSELHVHGGRGARGREGPRGARERFETLGARGEARDTRRSLSLILTETRRSLTQGGDVPVARRGDVFARRVARGGVRRVRAVCARRPAAVSAHPRPAPPSRCAPPRSNPPVVCPGSRLDRRSSSKTGVGFFEDGVLRRWGVLRRTPFQSSKNPFIFEESPIFVLRA